MCSVSGGFCQLSLFISCSAGSSNAIEGSSNRSACIPCRPGSAVPYPGASNCVPCNAGFFTNETGAELCKPCPQNTFQVTTGVSDPALCLACPPSTPLSPAGSSSQYLCSSGVICLPGLYTALQDPQPCTSKCPRGSYCQGGQARSCPLGGYTDVTGLGECKWCIAGEYGTINGSVSPSDCRTCPRSTWSIQSSTMTFCNPCPTGNTTVTAGAASAAQCISMAPCLSSLQLAVAPPGSVDDSDLLCPLAALQPTAGTDLLPGGVALAQSFLISAHKQLLIQLNERPLESTTLDRTTILNDLYDSYIVLHQAPSLRIDAFGSDPVLEKFSATEAAKSLVSADSTKSSSDQSRSSSATVALLVVMLMAAFLPLLCYRFLNAKLVLIMDQFAGSHQPAIGSYFAYLPTQLGAMMSWAMLCSALLVLILLGTQDNSIRTSELLPPSAAVEANTARATWQLTLRVHTGESADVMSNWCQSNSTSLLTQTGFSARFLLRAQPSSDEGKSCIISADCDGCGNFVQGRVGFKLPYSAQLLEWSDEAQHCTQLQVFLFPISDCVLSCDREIWVPGGSPGGWSRRYGLNKNILHAPVAFVSVASALTRLSLCFWCHRHHHSNPQLSP
jgi:hypothetical protein